MSYYGDVIHKLNSKTSAKLVFTSILPRLVDHIKTVNKVNKVNSELRKLCKRKHLLFCYLYKSFFYIIIHLTLPYFAPKDGLCLNYAGTDLLRKKIKDIIRHLSVY